MGDHDITPTCLSAEKHMNADARDIILHYLGCLEFCERESYYDSLDKEHQKQIESELRRIVHLRYFLQQDREESSLLWNLKNSIDAWKECELFTCEDGHRAVQTWRLNKGRHNDKKQRKPRNSISLQVADSAYDPDRDLNAYFIRYVQSQPEKELRDPRFNGHFPNHKIAVSHLLNVMEQMNPLTKESHPDKSINYFHFPANNMHWIERAIARYFSEDDLKYDGIFGENSDKERTKASAILRPEFWKGQQHGGRSASVHARHLRPLCETVSSNPNQVEAAPRNIVLFMPYLHWETDRQREKLSQALDLESERHRDAKQMREIIQKEERQSDRGELLIPILSRKGREVSWPKVLHRSQSPVRRASTAFQDWLSRHRKSESSRPSPFVKEKGRIIAGSAVGQVLLDAAALYEAMANYRDKMFIQKYLHKDPPLHPRRTLDQAYYWTLKTTKLRDRDQVVYRGTTVDPDLRHKLQLPKLQREGLMKRVSKQKANDERKFEWDCEERNNENRPRSTQESREGPVDSSSCSLEKVIGNRCPHCRDHIRKVSRVVMVDQLWMWILDEETIITCFPKRYGVNKQDPSGVHKSIRSRMKNLRKDHIRTVFDLALIILDECSNTFFDRTKTQDRQPQVMDIFSESIGKVNNKQTISFDHLWEWTGKLGSFAKPGYLPANLSDFVIPLLNINKEGQLQREIKDIIDELDIMIYITTQQRDVIKKFKKEVTHILDPSGTWKDKLPTTPISDSKSDEKKKRHDDYFWFVNSADELLSDVDDQIGELDGLRKSAESTSTSLDHLLNLKQQQASVFQTWQSTKQAEETMRQGRAIIIFTVMTIIFLPLGFIASIFGMNNKQISGDEMPMTLQSQFRYMFPISTGIISFALVIAFSDYVRTIIWLIYKYLVTLTVIKSGLYDHVYLSLDWKSKDLVRKFEDSVTQMKADVKKARQKRMAKHNQYSETTEEGPSSGSETRDSGSGSGSGVRARLRGNTVGATSSGSRFRPQSLKLGTTESGGEDGHHVIHMHDLGAANPTSAASTVPPTSARHPVVHAISAPDQLKL